MDSHLSKMDKVWKLGKNFSILRYFIRGCTAFFFFNSYFQETSRQSRYKSFSFLIRRTITQLWPKSWQTRLLRRNKCWRLSRMSSVETNQPASWKTESCGNIHKVFLAQCRHALSEELWMKCFFFTCAKYEWDKCMKSKFLSGTTAAPAIVPFTWRLNRWSPIFRAPMAWHPCVLWRPSPCWKRTKSDRSSTLFHSCVTDGQTDEYSLL